LPSQEIQKHVLDQYPVEACGFLSGRFDHGKAEAQRCVVVENVAASADRVVLDPTECERVRQNVPPDEHGVAAERDCLAFKTHRKDALMVKLEFIPDKAQAPASFLRS